MNTMYKYYYTKIHNQWEYLLNYLYEPHSHLIFLSHQEGITFPVGTCIVV